MILQVYFDWRALVVIPLRNFIFEINLNWLNRWYTWVSVKFARVHKLHEDTFVRSHFCTGAQNCTKTFLDEGSLLQEDTFARGYIFARADNFARSHFCTKGHFCTNDNFARRVNFARSLFLTRDGTLQTSLSFIG